MPKVKPLNKIAPTYCLHQLNASATSLVCPLQQQQATCPLAWDPSLHREARCSVRRYCTVRPTEPQMTARDQGSEKHFKKDRIKSIVDQPCCQDTKCLCHLGYRTPTRSCPSLAAAMLTADIGCPEAKLVVPSMGSTTHNQPGMMGTRNP